MANRQFNLKEHRLPVVDILDDLHQKISEHSTLIVTAPPGAGKSTLLPLSLLQDASSKNKIIMLEPRRLAAKSIATRMAELLGEPVGQTVGYRIRFESKTSDLTKIEVVTEGILTRMLQSDNSLEGIKTVIFDEFHERSIHADVALAFCRESQQILRPDLKIIIMSATLNLPKLSSLLQAPVIESKGRQYPVEIHYEDVQDEHLLPELTCQTIRKAINKHEGDILVFLPGQGEIRRCEEILRGQLKHILIYPLYGQLPYNQQRKAILPDANGRRKVVLSTSIAETSLTIEGIKIVIDSGFTRSSRYDPKSGISRLITSQITKDAADQRTGRAGRLSDGFCYRMWSLATQHRLLDHRVPEIEEADLTSLALDLASWGVKDPHALTWLTPPPKGPLEVAYEMLHQLGALHDYKITDHGKKVHRLPCHPRIAHMLIFSEKHQLVHLASDIAPFLEERDPLPKGTGIDINLRIEALRNYRKNDYKGGRMSKLEKIASSYRKIFEAKEVNEPVDDFETGMLLASAYPERIACSRPGNNAQFQLSNGKYAMVGHRDDLANESWLAVAQVDARDGMGKIFLASPLNPQDLMPLVKQVETITWNTREGGLMANSEMRIGNILLQSKVLSHPDLDKVHLAICEAIKNEKEKLLDFNEEVEQWQHRLGSLKSWRPSEEWPHVSTSQLCETANDWITPYLSNIKTPEDLKKLDILAILKGTISYEMQQKVEQLAPSSIIVPTGSKIKLQYREDGLPPILSVRLQELFGMSESPSINDGKNKVLLHLLSPGFKPVQVTDDLKSFWNSTYFEVKKELKRRYPKHEWPEDPWKATPTKGVKRKK